MDFSIPPLAVTFQGNVYQPIDRKYTLPRFSQSQGHLDLTYESLDLQYLEPSNTTFLSQMRHNSIFRSIPLLKLESIFYKVTWLQPLIELTVNEGNEISGLLGASRNRLLVYPLYNQYGLAKSFVNAVQLRLSELRLGLA
jgi:hypothetical protein